MPSPQSPPESPPDPLLAGVFALVPPPSAEPSSRPAAAPPPAAARPPADRPRAEPLPVLTPQGGRGQLSGRAWAGFAVGDLVGAGGMGEVYRARQEDLARIVALKVLPEAAGRDPVLRQRFNAEARAAARLHDANVVAIYDSGECDGRLWLAMEFVPGRGLDQALRERRQEGRPFTPLEAAGLAVQAAHGLAAAHRERLVHRDVKPGNLLLADDGTLKVADFGLVRILDDHTLTTAGSVLGTPLYLSPEQGRGLPAGPASDVYALGVVLYELLTLQPPFTGGSAEELVAQHNFTEPELPSRRNPDIPADLQAICLKCLQKDPARRFPDAGALAADLERVRLGLAPLSAIFPPGALSTGAAEAIRRLAGRRRQWLAAALVLAAVLAGLAAWGWWWDMRKTEVAAVRARLRPLAAVAPIPDTAAADLDRLAALAGGDDPQVAQGRAKLAAVAALAAAVAPDASAAAAQAALAGLREAVGDDGDPRLARWQAERAAAVGARRDLLARFLADPEPAPAARAAAAEALAWLHGHAGAEPVQARQVAERLAALDQEREELARRLAVLDAPRPLPAGIDAALARYERLAGFDDARATAWRTRLAAVHAVQARLAILDRAVPVPPEASGDLDRLIALVGAEDAQAAAWAGKLAAVRELIARLAAARERPQPVPAWIAGDLDRLAALVGGDPEITAWRQRIAAIAAVRGRLAALDQAAPPPAEAAADLARLAALVGDEDAQVRAGTAKLAALRELGGRLGAALARAEPEPAWVAADLARLAGLAGDGDALIAAWRARRAETARLHAALGDLARRIVLDAAAVADADRLLAEARRLVGEDAAVRAAAVRLAALRAPPRPAWAVAAGQDRHGPWAEFALGPVVQRLRWLPPLAYRIGSAADEAGHEDDEAVATVTIARGLWVAERECSQALYAAVLGAWPAERRDPDRPVEQVSRADAERCCARLSALLPGAVVRLPGEAEWEAAVRGGAAGPWAGLDEAQAVAAVAHHGSRLDAPLPVGSGPANAFGIQDGPGNVREWCRGAYGPPLAGAHLDPLPAPGRLGVVRGGSWADPLLKCRPANRAPLDPGARSPALGFRLVIEP